MMNTRSTPTRELERNARKQASGQIAAESPRARTRSPALSSSSSPRPSAATSSHTNLPRRSQALSNVSYHENTTRDNFSESSLASAGAISSFFLSQAEASQRERGNEGARQLQLRLQHQADADAGSPSKAARTRQQAQQSNQPHIDLSMMTGASDDDEIDSFGAESSYANRLNQHAAHVGQLLNGRSRRSTGLTKRNGKQRQEDDEGPYGLQNGGQVGAANTDQEDEMSDPQGQKRKHGYRSTPEPSRRNAAGRPAQERLFEDLIDDEAAMRRQNGPEAPHKSQYARFPRVFKTSQSFFGLKLNWDNVVSGLIGILLFVLAFYASASAFGHRVRLEGADLSSFSAATTKLTSRVSQVEHQISRFGKVQSQHSKTLDLLGGRVGSLEVSSRETDAQVKKWKEEMESGRNHHDSELRKYKKEMEDSLLDERQLLKKEIQNIRTLLRESERKIDYLHKEQRAPSTERRDSTRAAARKDDDAGLHKYEAELQRLTDRISTVEIELKETRTELVAMDERASAAESRASKALETILQDPTEWLARYLPDLVPVRWDQAGTRNKKGEKEKSAKLRVDEQFWTDLRTHFQQDFLTKSQRKAPDAEAAGLSKSAEDRVKAVSEQAVERTLDSLIADGVLLKRNAFLVLLEKELHTLSERIEEQLQRTEGKLEEERENRQESIRALKWAYEEATSSMFGSASDGHQRVKDGSRWGLGWSSKGARRASEPQEASVPSEDEHTGDVAAVMQLINEALALYSQDKLGRPDFALYSAGAQVIPELTSPSFGRRFGRSSTTGKGSLFSFWPSRSTTNPSDKERATFHLVGNRGRPPTTALHPDTSPGMCWTFAGSRGTLGVKLARPSVRVSHITIEHAPFTLLQESSGSADGRTPSALQSAPKRLQVWGRVTGDDVEQSRVRALSARRAADESRARLRRAETGDTESGEQMHAPQGRDGELWIRLGTFEYNIGAAGSGHQRSPSGHPHIQTFAVDPKIWTAGINVDAVQVAIASNHGDRRRTCLYRVRIHGEDVEPDSDFGLDN